MNQIKAGKKGVKTAGVWELVDCDRKIADIASIEQLEHAILSILDKALTPNTIVNLVSPHGDVLSIGIAGPADRDNPQLAERLACVNFTDPSGESPNRAVVGNASLTFENGGVIVFRCEEGTWTEILRRNCVSVDMMLRIVKHFYTTCTLPDWIDWEEV